MASAEGAPQIGEREKMTPESLKGEIRFTSENTFGRAMTKKVISENFGIPERLVTKSDVELLKKFAIYTGIKYIETQLFGSRSLRETRKKIRDRWSVIKELNQYGEGTARHDVAHIIWKALLTECGNVVPDFLTEESQIANENLLRQEVGASLFSNVYPGSRKRPINLFVALMYPEETKKLIKISEDNIRAFSDPEMYGFYVASEGISHMRQVIKVLSSIDHNSFESVFAALQEINILFVRLDTIRDYIEPKEHKHFTEKYDAMAQNVRSKPDVIAVQIARQIFNSHRSNPRVVMDIFLERCAPILSTLPK